MSIDQFSEARTSVGRRLKEAREALGESQEAFAKRMHVVVKVVYNYERGLTCPNAEQLQRLQDSGLDASFIAFGVPSLVGRLQREQFAAVLAWVRMEAKVDGIALSEVESVELAWQVFQSFARRGPRAQPDLAGLQAQVHQALNSLK